jgi:hypothetical protein
VRGAGVVGDVDGSGTGLADVGAEEGIADGVAVDDSRDGNGDGGIVGVFEVGAVEVSAVGCAVGLHINVRHERYLRPHPRVRTNLYACFKANSGQWCSST